MEDATPTEPSPCEIEIYENVTVIMAQNTLNAKPCHIRDLLVRDRPTTFPIDVNTVEKASTVSVMLSE